jgi:ribosome-associated toxin RatA of RatAB toxin-antitoxin module
VRLITQKCSYRSKFFFSSVTLVTLISIFSGAAVKVAGAPLSDDAAMCEKPTVTDEVISGKTFVVSRMLIKARPAQVWQVLADYGNAHRTFPMIKACQLIEDRGATKIMRHVLSPSGVPGTYKYVLEIRECAPKSMEWHRISGDFKDVDGFWRLEASHSGRCTKVTYASYVNGGFFLPQPLIRRQVHADMPTAMLALKNKAEMDQQHIAVRQSEVTSTQ